MPFSGYKQLKRIEKEFKNSNIPVTGVQINYYPNTKNQTVEEIVGRMFPRRGAEWIENISLRLYGSKPFPSKVSLQLASVTVWIETEYGHIIFNPKRKVYSIDGDSSVKDWEKVAESASSIMRKLGYKWSQNI